MKFSYTQKHKIKFSTLLTALVAASILCTLLILLVTSYKSEKDSLIKTTLALNYSKSEKMKDTVNFLFKSMKTSLQETTQYLDQNKNLTDDEAQHSLELIQNTNRYFNSITWVDETGLIRNIAPLSVGLKNTYITNEQTDAALRSRHPYVSAPFVAPTGRLLLLISEPFFDSKGSYRGLIGGTIYLEENNILNEILGQSAMDLYNSYYYVVDNNGKLIYHPDKSRIGDQVTANPIVRRMLNGSSGMEITTNTLGIEMAAAYSVVPETGWGIVQQTPMSSIQERLNEHIRKMLLYTLLPFFALLVLSIILAERLTRPFVKLANLMKEFSSGRHVQLPPIQSHWNREADYLTRSVTEAIDTMQKNQDQLEQKAKTDPLTGLSNRRTLNEMMETWSLRSQPYSVMIIDIDHFKLVNDTYGHPAGDEVLKQLASTIDAIVKDNGRCFRYGGEEFVVLLPSFTAVEAYWLAEQLRKKTETTITPVGKPVTISIGIAEFPMHANIPEKLFSLADQALYQSKHAGRNQTTIARAYTHNLPAAYQ
ncbi:sensor domain-containing diguanylate cyclase [Paenibacillus sp. HB172176]|uniref:sensor domain-containing diguanylate cyclase n=1 Tax=Paenibacillus sp. HB172176 TaxID=2493690 RepID=UPI00143B51EA|nr:sensor domain-containing diguanylate cyclase [Paenibacillus sp. HB172176]